MRTFEMHRGNDESGVSGVGKVLEGVVFSDGPCVVRWVTELNGRSEARYDSFASFVDIHINSHATNQTKVVFSDGEVYEQKPASGLEVSVAKPKRKRKAKLPAVVQEALQQRVGPVADANRPAKVLHSEDKKEQ